MDNYIKSVIVSLVLAITAWEIMCIAPQPINNRAASSASFIHQEANQEPFRPIQPPGYPIPPTQNPFKSGSNIPQTNITPNRDGIRDYVNQNQPIYPQPGSGSSNPTPQSSNRNVQPEPTVIQSGTNQGGVRDYVNPNVRIQPVYPPGTPNVNPHYSGQIVDPQPTVIQSGSRDYVNPNLQNQPQYPQNRNGNVSPQYPVQNPGFRNGSPQPTSIQSGTNRGAVRDYVNPSISQGHGSNTPGNPSNQHFRPSPRNIGSGSNLNTIQNPSNPFPVLPSKPSLNPGQMQPQVQPTTPLSYAQKVSGGATTKSPIGQPKPSVIGQPESPTTKKPDEGPNDHELRDFSEALLRRDVNNAAKYVTINLQGKTTSQSQEDKAPEKLLSITPDAYKISTISKLKLLHNNYILQTNENEYVTPQEKQEENDLLDTMLSTPIMQYTRNFLVTKGKLPKDPKEFKSVLKTLWFNMYSRGHGRIGSSGFEHIFLAELKHNEVSGMHNWVYFDQAESNKIVDYLGYMKKIDLGDKGAILKFHSKLNGANKPVSSMFIGTSPELEMALYTTCYLFRADRICPLRLNGHNFIIRTFNFKYRGKNRIGSAFPEI